MNVITPKIGPSTSTAATIDQVARAIATGTTCAELAPSTVDGGRVAVSPAECGSYILEAGGRLYIIDDTSTGAAQIAVAVWHADPGWKREAVLASIDVL